MSIHAVKRNQTTLAWDNRSEIPSSSFKLSHIQLNAHYSLPPVLRVKSGESVSFDCLDASNGQITPASTTETIAALVFAQLDQVSGPVFVEGAEPGDTLQVDVLAIETADWGWTAVIPGFGLLADEYPEPALKLYEIDKAEGYAWFDEEKGIRIPIRPFAGEMGVMRGIPGAFSTIPPYNTGVGPHFSHKIGFF